MEVLPFGGEVFEFGGGVGVDFAPVGSSLVVTEDGFHVGEECFIGQVPELVCGDGDGLAAVGHAVAVGGFPADADLLEVSADNGFAATLPLSTDPETPSAAAGLYGSAAL